MRFSGVIAAINELKERGLVRDYAIHGAVAQAFWDEAIPTFDLDVLVLLPAIDDALVSLSPLYEWARERGYDARAEHLIIGEIPVQFMPAPDALAEEAIATAETRELEGIPLRVVRPEYLIALWLQGSAKTARRRERVEKLRESGVVDEAVLADLMGRYTLSW